MTENGSYSVTHGSRSLDREMERLRAQALMGWHRESRALARFGLRDGLSVLELGCGPGFVTGQLLDMLPNSQITALDLDPTLLAMAEAYLRGEERVRFIEASIMDTGLPDGSFQFAVARLIFQHLPDPVGAAREVYRVLEPGGKLAIIDADDAMWGLADPRIEGLDEVIELYGRAQAARGGNRHVGRQLWRILQMAGFEEIDLDAVLVHSDEVGMEAFGEQMNPDRTAGLVRAGLLSESKLERLSAALTAFRAADRPMLVMMFMLACGRKP